MTPHRSELTWCGLCRQKIFWAVTCPNRKRMPLDPTPNEAGNVAAYKTGTGAWMCRSLRDGEQPAHVEQRYMPHFATCTARAAARAATTAITTADPAGPSAEVVSLAAERRRRRPPAGRRPPR